MDINEMSRKEFEALPYRPTPHSMRFRSLIILPTKYKHDSGYRAMDFIAVGSDGSPICRLSGRSDVLHIEGIAGKGKFSGNGYPESMPGGWSIDCLPKSGLLHMWPRSGVMSCGEAYSSFDIYSEEK